MKFPLTRAHTKNTHQFSIHTILSDTFFHRSFYPFHIYAYYLFTFAIVYILLLSFIYLVGEREGGSVSLVISMKRKMASSSLDALILRNTNVIKPLKYLSQNYFSFFFFFFLLFGRKRKRLSKITLWNRHAHPSTYHSHTNGLFETLKPNSGITKVLFYRVQHPLPHLWCCYFTVFHSLQFKFPFE